MNIILKSGQTAVVKSGKCNEMILLSYKRNKIRPYMVYGTTYNLLIEECFRQDFPLEFVCGDTDNNSGICFVDLGTKYNPVCLCVKEVNVDGVWSLKLNKSTLKDRLLITGEKIPEIKSEKV